MARETGRPSSCGVHHGSPAVVKPGISYGATDEWLTPSKIAFLFTTFMRRCCINWGSITTDSAINSRTHPRLTGVEPVASSTALLA